MHVTEKIKRQFKQILPIVITFIFAFSTSLVVYASQVKDIDINNKGKIITVKTMGKTVKDVLSENKIELTENDSVNPDLDTSLDNLQLITITEKPGSKTNSVVTETISVNTVETNEEEGIVKKTIVNKRTIPYKVTKKPNDKLKYGTTKVIQKGKPGVEEVTYLVSYLNDKKVNVKLFSKKTIDNPVTEIVEYGMEHTLLTSRGEVLRYRKCVVMRATAYDSSYESTGKRPGNPYYGITASGLRVRPGIVAVDPRVIPLGTRLYVESMQNGVKNYGIALAADTGGAIKGNKIDLYFETKHEVDNWGVRKVKVYILE